MNPSDSSTTVEGLKEAVRNFVKDREWEKYHTPRNLAESICIESSELLELFQWSLKDEESFGLDDPAQRNRLEDELADVLIYCLSLSNAIGTDIADVIFRKLSRNANKYPVQKYKGAYVKP